MANFYRNGKFFFLSPFILSLFLAAASPSFSEEEKVKAPQSLTPLSLGKCGEVTFKPGVRLQTRYLYDSLDNNNEIFIRRFRFKGRGEAFGLARYELELKIDRVGAFNIEPAGDIENAWVDFALGKGLGFFRVGLFNAPFSRDALTSDSKLLFMDRSLIKNVLTALGIADNTIGLLYHKRPFNGRFELYFGIFNNYAFNSFTDDKKMNSDQLMPAGRVVLNFLEPALPIDEYDDYRASYLCSGHRLALGTNSAYLGGIETLERSFNLCAWGIDLFYNWRRFTLQAEFDRYFEEGIGGSSDRSGYGWFVQTAYLIKGPFELALRYQELDSAHFYSGGLMRWTTIGLNVYIREHYLKVQSDYTFRRDRGRRDSHLFQMQLQLTY